MAKQKPEQKDFVSVVETEPKAKKSNKADKAKKKNGKVGFFKRIGGKFKDIFSELKKVNWPGFSKVVKQTGVVLVVVLSFLVVISAFDFGLEKLLTLIQG